MLRDKSLVPLSRQHQHALALCVRIDRASPVPDVDLGAWQAEITQLAQSEIAIHFAAEESVLFLVARRFAELTPLVEELLADHKTLREDFRLAESRAMSGSNLSDFARRLSAHIRKEERRLFESLQELLGQEEMARLGSRLAESLEDAAHACILPNETTTLKPRTSPH